jgi:hypothetical protein
MNNDDLLTGPQAAIFSGLTPSDFRNRVNSGRAPSPDEADEGAPANRRTPRWRRSTLIAWNATRSRTPGPRVHDKKDSD